MGDQADTRYFELTALRVAGRASHCGGFGPQHFVAHPDKIDGSGPFEDGEEMGGGLEKGPQAEKRAGERGGVAQGHADGGPPGPAHAMGEGMGDDQHHRWAWDEEEDGGSEEKGEVGLEGHNWFSVSRKESNKQHF